MSSESPWAAKRPIPFTNVSGETIPAFAAMAITGLVYENGIALLQCDKPSALFRRDYAVNNMFDVPADLRGTCFRAGEVRVLYDAGEPDEGTGWGPKPGQWTVAQGFPGFSMQGAIDTNHRIAKVQFDPIAQSLAKTTAIIDAGSTTQHYRVYSGPLGSETDAGFTSVPPARNRSSLPIANGSWCWLAWTNNGWELQRDDRFSVGFGAALADIAAGATGAILAPGIGLLGNAINWSDDVDISTGDKVLGWREPYDNLYYCLKAGGAGVKLYEAVLDGDLDAGDATASVDSALDIRTGASASITSARNPYGLHGADLDECLILATPGIGSPAYLLLRVDRSPPRMFLATLGESLTNSMTEVDVTTTAALDGGPHPGALTDVNNRWHKTGANSSPCLIVENKKESPIEYELLEVNHVKKTILADVDWDSPDLTRTYQDITVMHEADPATPEAYLSGDAVTYVESVDWSDPTLSYTKRTAIAFSDASDGSTTILTAVDVNVVIDVDVSGTTFRKNQQQVRVLASDTAGGLTTYHTGTECGG